MNIAIDVDDVLLQLVKRFLEKCNDKFDKNYEFDDVDNYDFWKNYGLTREEVMPIFESVQAEAHLLDICDEEAPKYMKKLKKYFNVDILTVRPERVRSQLIQKLNDLGICRGSHYDNAVFVPYDPRDAKITLYNYDIYVDDNPNLVSATNNHNEKLLLLYDQPWNRDLNCGDKVIRVRNWKEIYNTIQSITK